jgi:hypothetical protein
MKFVVEIELLNDAMQTADDVAQALYSIADGIVDITGSDPLEAHEGLFRNVRDGNGNTVGIWQVKPI